MARGDAVFIALDWPRRRSVNKRLRKKDGSMTFTRRKRTDGVVDEVEEG